MGILPIWYSTYIQWADSLDKKWSVKHNTHYVAKVDYYIGVQMVELLLTWL